MEELRKIAAQITEMWQGLSSGKKKGLIAALLAAAVGLGLSIVSMQPSFGLLFRVSDPQEAGEIVSALDSAKIPYRLTGQGTTIEVNKNDIDRARILLAQQKLPHSGSIDFRIYDDPSPGWTRNTEKINFQRALQGELERTITTLEAVQAARVHLTLPAKSSFRSEQVPPSASVTLKIRQGRQLSEANIRAITHLVAASVERLEAGEVVLVDTSGRLLSRNGLEDIAGPTLDYQRDLEKNLELKVRRLLEPIVGVGRLQVSAQTQVDFSQTHTQEEFYDPEQLATRSESAEEEVDGQRSAQGEQGGLAGATSNQPGAVGTGGRGQGGQTKGHRRTRSTKSYEVNRTVVETQGPKATLKSLTVSVLVDGRYVPAEEGGVPVYTPRSPEDLKELQTLVENAVGYNPTRGDRITISSKQFLTPPPHLDPAFERQNQTPMWIYYAAGGGGLALVALAFFLMRGRRSKSADAQVVQIGSSVSEAQAALDRGLSGDLALAQAQEEQDELERAQRFRDNILEAAADNPERAAEVLRAWIHDDAA